MEVHPHLRLHGETQKGKTALARLLTLWALLRNWRVVILDRRKFKDWHPFQGYAELCDASQPTALIDQLPTEWPSVIKSNVGAVVTFYQPRNMGQGAGYSAAHTLPPYHFAFQHTVYKAPYLKPEIIAPGLAQTPPHTPPPLIPESLRLPAAPLLPRSPAPPPPRPCPLSGVDFSCRRLRQVCEDGLCG